MARDLSLQGPANFLHYNSICMTSSLVGASTNTRGPSPSLISTFTARNHYLGHILVMNVDDGRQHESKGFPRTCLSNTNHITTRESDWPSLTLNTGWLWEALLREGLVYILGEPSFFKCGHRARNVVSLNRHLVLSPELLNFLLGPLTDLFVFLKSLSFSIICNRIPCRSCEKTS